MQFDSFEQALKACLTAEEGSLEQDEALIYCLENAPPDLKKMLEERYHRRNAHNQECGCGCKH